MNKFGAFLLIAAAACGIATAEAGAAAAAKSVSANPVVAPGGPASTGTGSAASLADFLQGIMTGSAGLSEHN
ncbi:hypothetical protein [Nocardia terpenica]|uniref:Uncharacterized protein n=1 Tax=Nocardia terpenica TaxID=455432 RepID=A0A291RNC6_9NOCA|nr:hypothetical protein [Nocardia terpenica]ATL68684.1 hypothetical protein CRH09_23355 [Nocardia terpenica]